MTCLFWFEALTSLNCMENELILRPMWRIKDRFVMATVDRWLRRIRSNQVVFFLFIKYAYSPNMIIIIPLCWNNLRHGVEKEWNLIPDKDIHLFLLKVKGISIKFDLTIGWLEICLWISSAFPPADGLCFSFSHPSFLIIIVKFSNLTMQLIVKSCPLKLYRIPLKHLNNEGSEYHHWIFDLGFLIVTDTCLTQSMLVVADDNNDLQAANVE